MYSSILRLFVFVALGLLSTSAAAQFQFVNATNETKINQTCQSTTDVGGGVIVFDIDNDGWEDLYLPGGADLDKLYRNMGDGTFTNVMDPIFAKHDNHKSYTQGGTAFDFDKDGLTDLFEACKRKDLLWKNMGDGTFINYSQPANIEVPAEENASHGASYGDVDGDGDNDLYVARWISYLKEDTDSNGKLFQSIHGFPNHFYINNGTVNNTFTERAVEFGVADSATTNIALLFDFDKDGDLDIFAGNDYGMYVRPNHVYKNLLAETGVMSFTEVAKELGLDAELFTMTVTPNDFDRNGIFDVLNTTIGGDYLFCMMQDGKFKSMSSSVGLKQTYDSTSPQPVSWATLFADFDNDGWEDCFVTHGFIRIIINNVLTSERDTSRFYRNVNGTFTDVTLTEGTVFDGRGRGAALVDYNKDGRMDIVVGSINFIPGVPTKDYQVFKNVTPISPDRNWIQIQCKAIHTAPEAIGTTIEVWENGIRHMRQVTTGGGMVSCASLVQHFGLGPATTIDSIILYWPMTKDLHRQVDRYYNVPVNQRISYTEKPKQNAVGATPVAGQLSLFPSVAASTVTVSGLSTDEETTFEILSPLGVTFAKYNGRKNEVELPVTTLPTGQYFIRATNKSNVQTLKFVKLAQ
jgi:enediyne biosynthesis protein E4